jgi:hypothetical protein
MLSLPFLGAPSMDHRIFLADRETSIYPSLDMAPIIPVEHGASKRSLWENAVQGMASDGRKALTVQL